MNRKQILLAVLTFDFLALTGWAIYQHGYLGIFASALDSSASVLLAVDLLLAIAMVVGWMWVDASRHGLRVWPYLLLTATARLRRPDALPHPPRVRPQAGLTAATRSRLPGEALDVVRASTHTRATTSPSVCGSSAL
jgi:hypothetical protein